MQLFRNSISSTIIGILLISGFGIAHASRPVLDARPQFNFEVNRGSLPVPGAGCAGRYALQFIIDPADKDVVPPGNPPRDKYEVRTVDAAGLSISNSVQFTFPYDQNSSPAVLLGNHKTVVSFSAPGTAKRPITVEIYDVGIDGTVSSAPIKTYLLSSTRYPTCRALDTLNANDFPIIVDKSWPDNPMGTEERNFTLGPIPWNTIFYDADGDTLNYLVTGLPDWLTYDVSNQTLKGRIANGVNGFYSYVNLRASDAEHTISMSFSIGVARNRCPRTQLNHLDELFFPALDAVFSTQDSSPIQFDLPYKTSSLIDNTYKSHAADLINNTLTKHLKVYYSLKTYGKVDDGPPQGPGKLVKIGTVTYTDQASFPKKFFSGLTTGVYYGLATSYGTVNTANQQSRLFPQCVAPKRMFSIHFNNAEQKWKRSYYTNNLPSGF